LTGWPQNWKPSDWNALTWSEAEFWIKEFEGRPPPVVRALLVKKA